MKDEVFVTERYGVRSATSARNGYDCFFDVSTCINELLKGLDHSVQLTIGAGAFLAYKGYKTVKENREIKRRHKMSYMLAIERELGRRISM